MALVKPKLKNDFTACLDRFENKLFEKLKIEPLKYIPTGLQEDIIYSVGCGKYQIVVAIDANRVGKTTAIVNIAKQIIWPEEHEHFSFWEGENLFRKWPFQTKRFRITGTPTNLADNGALQQAIAQWWPKGRYEKEKAGKHYYSAFKCENWEGDALTYEQSATEYEGQTLSLVLSDEPPKPSLIGAINSRMAEGGIWVIGMTPIDCGLFLDILDDLQDKGKRIKVVTGSVFENDIETGKPNHNNTRRGLWNKAQIDDYISGIPVDEREARIYGKASHKSGKIYPKFTPDVHCIDFDHYQLKNCNLYMSIDPHYKYFPAISWYAITPSSVVVKYNEWPDYDTLGMWYDEARQTKHCGLSLEALANKILAGDMVGQYGGDKGYKITRTGDPHFLKANPDFIRGLKEYGVQGWIDAPNELIETQRINLQKLIDYNPDIPLIGINLPSWYEDKNRCKNSIRAKLRHSWDDKKEKESELFKDFIDDDRYFLSIVDGKPVYQEQFDKRNQGVVKSFSALQSEKLPIKGYFDQKGDKKR